MQSDFTSRFNRRRRQAIGFAALQIAILVGFFGGSVVAVVMLANRLNQ